VSRDSKFLPECRKKIVAGNKIYWMHLQIRLILGYLKDYKDYDDKETFGEAASSYCRFGAYGPGDGRGLRTERINGWEFICL
jgi:hypothetical protein